MHILNPFRLPILPGHISEIVLILSGRVGRESYSLKASSGSLGVHHMKDTVSKEGEVSDPI